MLSGTPDPEPPDPNGLESGRIDNILRKAKHILTDKQSDRYNDEVLLDHLDDAQRQVVADAGLLSTEIVGTILTGVATYSAPADSIILKQITIAGKRITAYTFDGMNSDVSWEGDTGAVVERVLFDDGSPLRFRFYPIPTAPETTSYKLWYTRLPTPVTLISDILEVPMSFDQAMVHFVVYKAMMGNAGNAGTTNSVVAIEHLSLYAAQVGIIMSISSANYSASANLTSRYIQ
jgi:hypothetical protein